MLSPIDVITIFLQVLVSGILFTGAYIFVVTYLNKKDLSLFSIGLALFFLGLFSAEIVIFQLISNIFSSTILQKIFFYEINISLVIFSIFYLLHTVYKNGFNLKLYSIIAIATFLFIALLILFPIESFCVPQTSLKTISPSPMALNIFYFSLIAYIFASIRNIFLSKTISIKKLNLFLTLSILLVFLGYASIFTCLFLNYLNPLFWILIFSGFSLFLICNVIPPESPLASHPLRFLKTKILIKLMTIFVLLLVIIVEAITLATISIAKNSLGQTIAKMDEKIAQNIAQEIKEYVKNFSINEPEKLNNFAEIIKMIGKENNRSLIIFDIKATPIIYFDNFSDTVKLYPNKQLVKGLKPEKENNITFQFGTNKKMIGYYKKINNTPLSLLIFHPEEIAYYEIRKLETISLLFVIIGMVVASIAGFYFSKTIEKPINALIKGTEEIRKGNLNFVITTDSEDEIGLLAKEFNAMTAELKESQEHIIASEKLAALGTMAAGMAHEIKNPLVAIRTFTQLLPLKWSDEEFRKKFLSVVPPEIDKINKIAENLLKFGKPSKPDFKPINVESVLEEVLELVDNQIKKNKIRVTTKYAKTPKIYGDFGQLSQAFLNIIINAIQAMKDGGELIIKTDVGMVIQLSQTAKPTTFTFKNFEQIKPMGKQSQMVFIEITDSGPGISEQTMKNMFDPFFTTKEHGTGMGLPITLRIIEDHKGSIKLRSQLGKGTTFIIMIPPIEENTKEENQTI